MPGDPVQLALADEFLPAARAVEQQQILTGRPGHGLGQGPHRRDAHATSDAYANESVWERWNARSTQQQASGCPEYDAALLLLLAGLSAEQREQTTVKPGFLPAHLPLASAIGMRLNESAQHSLDVRVSTDPQATLDGDATAVLVDHFTGGLGFLLDFLGRADQLVEPAVIAIADNGVAIVVDETVRLSRSSFEPTTRFGGELEAALRLVSGGPSAPQLPPDLTMTGNVTLDDLQRTFPGFASQHSPAPPEGAAAGPAGSARRGAVRGAGGQAAIAGTDPGRWVAVVDRRRGGPADDPVVEQRRADPTDQRREDVEPQ